MTSLVQEIAELVRDRRLDGITDLLNESSRDEMRIALVLARDASPHRLLSQLYERTAMQRILDVNMTALVPQPGTNVLVPSLLTLKNLLQHFIAHRHAIIARRVQGNGMRADLRSREARMGLMKEDLTRIAAAYGDRRRTEIRGEAADPGT